MFALRVFDSETVRPDLTKFHTFAKILRVNNLHLAKFWTHFCKKYALANFHVNVKISINNPPILSHCQSVTIDKEGIYKGTARGSIYWEENFAFGNQYLKRNLKAIKTLVDLS